MRIRTLPLVMALIFGLQISSLSSFATVPALTTEEIESKVQLTDKDKKNLNKGQVVVGFTQKGASRYVLGRILLDATPEQIWSVLANPYEFQNGIYSRMKDVQMLEDEPRHSVMRCKISVGLVVPDVDAVVESDYTPMQRIAFHRKAGSLKALDGGWKLTPRDNGKTEVSYWMSIDPGIPVPGWLVNEGVKSDLPKTLVALRKRLNSLKTAQATLLSKSILAASVERRDLFND
jgi:carbon monoxide dehydrogenase subunit G